MHDSWTNADLASAMCRAAESCANPRYLRLSGHKLLFNGFWRSGDKQNICIWLNSATWHDAKTGDGGGCKEFAQIAFGLSLPEFMNRFGQVFLSTRPYLKPTKSKVSNPESSDGTCTDSIWQSLLKRDQNRLSDPASDWLCKVRGFKSPRAALGQAYANLTKEDFTLFGSKHRPFLNQRLSFGPQLIAPIRGVNSDEVKNLFLRTISPVSKQDKSRLLTGLGGWTNEDGSPRAFGFPSQIHEFPNLLICEGLADYFAAEYLLREDEKFLPLGAPNAAFLTRWAEWLKTSNYRGKVVWIYQLDVDENGQICSTQPGQLNATKASKILRTAGISSELFNWGLYLRKISGLNKIPHDLADLFEIVRDDQHQLTEAFIKVYKREQND